LHRIEDRPEVIRKLVAPIVRESDGQPWFRTFHFLNYSDEEGPRFLFRINLDSEKKEWLRAQIDSRRSDFDPESHLIASIDYRPEFIQNPQVLRQEQARFGKGGLDVFLKYFEYVSRTVLGLLERPDEEAATYPIKYRMTCELFHFLLNPLSYPSLDGDGEIAAHLAAILERFGTMKDVMTSKGMAEINAIKAMQELNPSIESKDIGLRATLKVEGT